MPVAGYLFRMSDRGPVLAPCPACGPCDLCEFDDVKMRILDVCSKARAVNICDRCVPRVQEAMPAGKPITATPSEGSIIRPAFRSGPQPDDDTRRLPPPPSPVDGDDNETAQERESREESEWERSEFKGTEDDQHADDEEGTDHA